MHYRRLLALHCKLSCVLGVDFTLTKHQQMEALPSEEVTNAGQALSTVLENSATIEEPWQGRRGSGG